MSKMDISSDEEGAREILQAARRLPPAPPSIGSQSSVSSRGGRRCPAPPSLSNSESSATGSRRSVGTSSMSVRSTKRRGDWDEINIEEGMAADLRRELEYDRHRVNWIPPHRSTSALSYNQLVLGRIIDVAQSQSSVETTYCNSHLLQKLMDIKYEIRHCQSAFYDLRKKLNTFHNVNSQQMFQNSDAVKMANIDALMKFQLSSPKDGQGNNLIKSDEVLFFADLCDGPGGFAEYFLWKKKWFCHGFGFTSRHSDWNLPPMPHYSAECFDAHYGAYNRKGQGNIHNPREVDRFMYYVKKSTDFRGVHVVLANAGDESTADEDLKEVNCRYTIMSELMVALNILRDGGHLVIRVFDSFTHFTVGLIYLMYRTFDSVAVHRPDTAVTASSERYILCKGRKTARYVNDVSRYLLDSLTLYKNSNSGFSRKDDEFADILQLVPSSVLRNAQSFFDYIYDHNEHHGREQLNETSEITSALRLSMKNENYVPPFVEQRRKRIWKKATSMWGIPHEFKHRSEKFTATTSLKPEIRAAKLIRPDPTNTLISIERNGESELNFETMDTELVQPNDWNFAPVGRDRGFFMGLGGKETYRFMGEDKWEKYEKIELCNNTLVYADVVEEILIYDDTQKINTGFHIIDAMILGGKDVRALPYRERTEYAKKFALSLDKPNREDLWSICAKTPRPVTEIVQCLNTIKRHMLKAGSQGPTKSPILPVDSWKDLGSPTYQESKMFRPTGFAFFRTNKGHGLQGDFVFCLQNRLFWRWTELVDLDMNMKGYEEDANQKIGPIHAPVLINHIKEEIKKSNHGR